MLNCCTLSPLANLGSVIALLDSTPSPLSTTCCRIVRLTRILASCGSAGAARYLIAAARIAPSPPSSRSMMHPRSGWNSAKTRSSTPLSSSSPLSTRDESMVVSR